MSDCEEISDVEEEFLLPTQLPTKVRGAVSVPLKVSVVEYFFLVTFNWDLMVGEPFQLNVLEVISDFPEAWIKGPLSKINRQQKVSIKAFGGGQYSLFCKVQKGT